jgi:hypothetical protein
LFEFHKVHLSTENGTRREISTSKIKKRMAIRKNWNENGGTVSVFVLSPHSNGVSSFTGVRTGKIVLKMMKSVEKKEANRTIVVILTSPLCLIGNKTLEESTRLINRS